MKITSVDIIALEVNGGKSMPYPVGEWRPVLCRIHTSEGIYGLGEAALAFGKAAPSVFSMLKDIADLIIGMNPLDTELIWDKLYKTIFWGQNGGPIVFAAISAIDIALWDIKGKYFQVPVYQLLGGKRREKLRTYASQLHYGWSPEVTVSATLSDYAQAGESAVEQGYTAVKLNPFLFDENGQPFPFGTQTGLQNQDYLNLVEERVSEVRKTVGNHCDIIIELYSVTDAQPAIQIANRLEKYNIFFIEEPNTMTPKTVKRIQEMITIPIAGGERIYSRWQYAPYFENGSLGLIQPDLGTTGGFTEAKKIADMAYVYDVGVQAHVAGTPLSIAASLHFEAVIPNFVIHEHHVFNIANFNRNLCIHDYQPKDGYIEIPDFPGIGNDLSEVAKKHMEIVTVKERITAEK